jgi:hypothetical protein
MEKSSLPWSPKFPYLVVAALALMSAVTLATSRLDGAVSIVGFSFLLNLLVVGAVVATFGKQGHVTCALVHVLAVWLTMVLAPFASFLNDRFASLDFFSNEFSEERVITANLIVLIWVLVFAFCYLFMRASRRHVTITAARFSKVWIGAVWIQLLSGFVSLWYLYEKVGLGIFTRKAFEDAIAAESVSEFILVSVPLRMLSIFAIAVAFLTLRGQSLSKFHRWLLVGVTTVLILATLAINNPIAAPRYFIGSVAVGVLFMVWLGNGKRATQFVLLVFVAVFGVFPLDFGRQSTDIIDAATDIEYSVEASFGQDNFRTYEALIAALIFTEKHGAVNGRQLAGNLLFWIPRSIWTDKPIATGTFLAEQEGQAFTNVACPLQCEGVVNFGLFGFPLLAFIFAVFLRKLDAWYWKMGDYMYVSPSNLLYPFLLGNVFFITRGDLLSPLAYTVTMGLATLPIFVTSAVANRIRAVLRT